MSNSNQNLTPDESQLREIIERWSKAVREENFEAIRANHDSSILMFDVPPPFLSRGLDAYMETWKLFFASVPRPVKFEFDDIQIHPGDEVAFATATGHCRYTEPNGQIQPLDFRLTMGFRKIDGRWRIVHEHHSVPAA